MIRHVASIANRLSLRPPALITGDDFEAAVPRLGLEEAGQATMLLGRAL